MENSDFNGSNLFDSCFHIIMAKPKRIIIGSLRNFLNTFRTGGLKEHVP